jgi:hypothetical protein
MNRAFKKYGTIALTAVLAIAATKMIVRRFAPNFASLL